MTVRRVMVFPAGTEVGLEIFGALHLCKEIELFGAGQDISSHAPFVFHRYHVLPSIHEDGWLESLVALCRQLSIDYIFPAYDDVIVALVARRDQIPAVVLAPELDTCLLTRSKAKTYASLCSVVRVPRVFDLCDDIEYPVIVKPDCGQGSQGVFLAHERKDMLSALSRVRDGIVCEYLPGDEFTVDCFSDRDRGVLFCGARIRLRMRNGIAVNTRTVELPGVHEIAMRIHNALSLRGAWFFQLKQSANGELTLLEVAPRIAGSMSAHRVLGVNFPLLTIFEHERLAFQVLTNSAPVELDRALRNRYRLGLRFGSLYIDLDDTLVLRDALNLEAVRLVFACINRGIKVILITRHTGNLDETLAKYRLAGLFDQVIHLNRTQRKADFIVERDAVFVDDSFSERLEVHRLTGVPTFDCSMIEALTDIHPINLSS